jgi:hypothetical protein
MINPNHREDLMASWVWILIAIAAVVIIALLALEARRRRTAVLRQRFGPEYDRTVGMQGGRHAAEAELRARERQRAQLDIKPLPEAARLHFVEEWRKVQERFVDQPPQAVANADTLVTRVMEARGYPMRDFEAQADLVSVDHPDVVENYRFAHGVSQRSQEEQTSTEDLREALLRYRSLFDELLRPGAVGTAAAGTGEAGTWQAPAGVSGHTPAPAGNDLGTGVSPPAEGAATPTTDAVGSQTDDAAYEDQPVHRGGL